PFRSAHPSPISCGLNLLDLQETAKYTSRHKKEVLINNSIKHLFNIFQFHMIFLSFCKYAAPKYIEKLQGDVNENGQKILDSRARDAW
ncbi:MAG: hypothetical protein WAW22_00475, partial [Smithellaceae bacterium]